MTKSAFVLFTMVFSSLAFAGKGSSVGSVAAMTRLNEEIRIPSTDYSRLKSRLDSKDVEKALIPKTEIEVSKSEAGIHTLYDNKIVLPEAQ